MGFLQQITGGGNIIPGVDNPFQSGKTVWLPGAGGLNPLNSQSAVGQLTKDLGALNPYNPDSVAGKVVDNIGKDMAKDPAKWVAIAACIATGQVQFIPYINAIATVTSKETSPEDWLKEGAKAYVISAGGEWVSNNVTGVGPQTDITTGETFAGTGASGAMNSAKAGAVAGNISRNIFSTAARKGSTDINSAQIVTGAITNEALNEAFKFMPGFDTLDKSQQAATVNAFKVAFNKDSNAAYQLFNQGFDATIKGLNDAAKAVGYKDLNQQNAVNNFVQNQGSTEDVEAFNRVEKDAQDKYDNYVAYQDKQKAFDAAQKEYIAAKGQYDYYNGLLTPGPGRYKVVGVASWQNARDAAAATMNAANKTMGDNRVQPEVLQQANDEYVNARAKVLDQNVVVNTYINQGWDNLAQQKEAATAGYTTPEAYDTYLIDKPNTDAIKEGWDSLDEKKAAATAGYTDPTKYDTYLTDKTANEAAVSEGWTGSAQKAEAATAGYKDPTEYTNYLSGLNTDVNTGGTSTTTGDGTAMGDTTKPLAGADAYKYDPANKTYTLTSDDGSTITLDENGDVVSSTEATDTSWSGLTDEKTGNLKLPKLPSGFTPTVKPPAKKTTTTTTTTTGTGNTAITTGTGNTAITTGTGNTAITTGSNTAVVTGSGTTALNSDQILSLLNVFGGSSGQQQQQVPYTPAQVPVADIKSYYNTIRGIAGENLLPESKEEKEKSSIDNLFAEGGTVNKSYDDVIRGIAGENLLGQPKEKKEKSSIEEMFFEGGTVDDLLRILRS
jgi:hypothetical protein